MGAILKMRVTAEWLRPSTWMDIDINRLVLLDRLDSTDASQEDAAAPVEA